MDTGLTPAQRTLRATIAAHELWARRGPAERAAHARRLVDARWQKYLDRVDPEGTMPEAERVQRAENARRADMARLSLAGVTARRRKAEERAAAARDAELAALDDEDQAAGVAA